MTTALVLGGADCLDDDLVTLGLTDPGEWDGPVVGINDALYTYEGLTCMATLHPEKVPPWRRKRAERGWESVPVWSFKDPQYNVEVWRPDNVDVWTRGSSGLFAVGVALYPLGSDAVVLAGVPMDQRPNRYRSEAEWRQHGRYRKGWTDAQRKGWLEGVRSVSGWTRETLGAPEWLDAQQEAA